VALADRYPREVALRDGSRVTLRLMNAGDFDAILRFAGSLSPDDLLFLRTEITTPEGVKEWLASVASGDTTSVIALKDDELIGYVLVSRNPARWTRRVGEIRINIAPNRRNSGLGRALTGEIFDVARDLGLRKLSAQMTPDQRGARSVFQHMGFQVEAILSDWVEDRLGRTRDLLVMTYDLDGFTNQVDE
jgi:L-amino acid N-acyltransferase YncA